MYGLIQGVNEGVLQELMGGSLKEGLGGGGQVIGEWMMGFLLEKCVIDEECTEQENERKLFGQSEFHPKLTVPMMSWMSVCWC
ncbi:MAG: hypothetical protein CMF28_05310 [Kiritimatiellaceae bacterium]|nr:hypothetical protein [Kiritimatiellaceae bacterium]